MSVLEIEGGYPLYGEVALAGAKNAVLPMLFAGCLSRDETLLENVPTGLGDVVETVATLRHLGAEIIVDGSTVRIRRDNFPNGQAIPPSSKTRCSLLMLGLCAALGEGVRISRPGGCTIGNRKNDIHLDGLRDLGAVVAETGGWIELLAGRCKGADITLRYPSSTGTINLIIAAAMADGITVIRNPSRKPEVLDAIGMLFEMGAMIREHNGALVVTGVHFLNGAWYRVMADRLVAATVMAGAAMTRGQAVIVGASLAPLPNETEVWKRAGMTLAQIGHGVLAQATDRLAATSIETGAHLMFHSDIQPLHGAMMTLAGGKSRIKETTFDNRFAYLDELRKMKARARVFDGGFTCANGNPGQVADIHGVRSLKGAHVTAPDIRGGAALVLAGLAADGTTTVDNIEQIDRGYERIEELFGLLGAHIRRRDGAA
ncbi:MAG TPA: UDP-N-acetylglucosamine 1-carboxyvinyltransferase [Hyphomicrobiaceae bacterium]|nr:UDP-N-acetylglucosamine 1-carboxyvinyltransferase [Hyphomicrobiaceae bacterium]